LRPTSPEKPPTKPFPFRQEIEDLERELAGHHAKEAAATKPATPPAAPPSTEASPDDPIGDHAGRAFEAYWDDGAAIDGEPAPKHNLLWGLGKNADACRVMAAMDITRQLKERLEWARAEIIALRAGRSQTPHAAAAEEIKASVLAALSELMPMAKRKAKRGSPALLRLIANVAKTKL
jgi:hypothetical protein